MSACWRESAHTVLVGPTYSRPRRAKELTMTADLSAAIAKLRQLSPKLNHVTDEANQVVSMVERFLNEECRIGIPCAVMAWAGDENDDTGFLAYDRHGGRFRIVVQTQP